MSAVWLPLGVPSGLLVIALLLQRLESSLLPPGRDRMIEDLLETPSTPVRPGPLPALLEPPATRKRQPSQSSAPGVRSEPGFGPAKAA